MNNQYNKVGFLFDLDGVLIDSESEYSRIWAQINSEFPTGIENLEEIIKGCTLTKILNDHYNDLATQAKVAKRLHELENQMHYEYLPFAHDFLVKIKEKGIPCALVTSSDNEKMKHLWEEIPDIKDFFDVIITGELVNSSKPSPEGYLLGAEKINRNPINCAVFEDSKQGVMAGKNANSLVVGMVGTLKPADLAPFSDILINNFNELDLDQLIFNLSER